MTRSGVSPQIINLLNRSILDALGAPDVMETFAREGGEAVGSTPEQFDAYVRAETVKWGKIVKRTGIRPD